MRSITTTVAVMALITAGCGQGSDSDSAGASNGDLRTAPVATDEPEVAEPSPDAPRSTGVPLPASTPQSSPETVVDTQRNVDARLHTVFSEARTAMVAGRCELAISLLDELLDDASWMESSGLVRETRAQRADCADYAAIDRDAADPAAALAALLAFLADRPATDLELVVTDAIQELYRNAGVAALSAESCDAIDRDFSLVALDAPVDARVGCASAYRVAGRTADADGLALSVLGATDDAAIVSQAVEILSASGAICLHLADGESFSDAHDFPDALAALFRGCLADAAGRDDLETLAGLQVAFLTDLPGHADAPAVEAALVDNVAACDLLGSMRRNDALGDGFLLSKTLACAQVADFVGEVDEAIDLYEWFLDRAGSDPGVVAAEAGLARNLIVRAREGPTSEVLRPDRSGSRGGGHAWLVFANDTRYEQQIVVSGPDTRLVTVEASPSSSTYDQPPGDCRSDVPIVSIDVAPGSYEVMIFDDVAPPQIGTWELRAGAEYGWCAYYVRA